MKTEIVQRIKIPIIADSVLSPQVYFGRAYYDDRITGIYFNTQDDCYGRITFENFDSIKISRGEMLPYEYDWGNHESGVWVFKIENSKWLEDRYKYEKKHYGGSYEFGGNVEEMKTDFSHYIFSFHDEFVEVIARGFWFEKNDEPLFEKPLKDGHPFLPISDKKNATLEAYDLRCMVRINDKAITELINDTKYCTQKIMEFILKSNGKERVNHTLKLTVEEGKVISHLCGFLGNKIATFSGIASLAEVEPFIKKYLKEISENRKNER